MISELQASCLFFQWSFALGFNSLWFRFRLASPRFAFALCANQAACRNKCLTSVLSNSSGEYLWFSVFFFDFFLCESARQVFRFCVHNSKLTSFDHIKARNNIFKKMISIYVSVSNVQCIFAANHKDYPNNKRSRENLACDEQQLTATSTAASAMNGGNTGGRTPPLMRSCSSPAVYGKYDSNRLLFTYMNMVQPWTDK